jgi:hypothetical protein
MQFSTTACRIPPWQIGDADVLQSLWADDLEVDVPKMPAMSKTEVMAFARSGRMKFLRYATSDINIRVYGDAAVVTGRLQRTRTLNGQDLSDDWRFTKVYTRHAQTWRVVSFHASEAARGPHSTLFRAFPVPVCRVHSMTGPRPVSRPQPQ